VGSTLGAQPSPTLRLNVALIVPRTTVEGPGTRFALWTQGCPLRCPGCCNPEMLAFLPRQLVPVAEVAAAAVAAGVEGVTFLGGEPFAQADALAWVAAAVRAAGLSVMVFSGYTLAELLALPGPGPAALLAATDLLVDGRYDEGRRTTRRRFVGSDNQILHFLGSRYHPDDAAFLGPNGLELRLEAGAVTLVGFPVAGARTRP
jgi:anaerobic ribonucleoside-triphosphate reductase activating protein